MMLIWVVLAAFAIALFLLFGAMVEMYRSLEQIRIESDIIDSLTPVDVQLGHGLPESSALHEQMAGEPRAIVLVLSDMCSTCRKLAERLAGRLPDSVWLVFEPKSPETGQKWLSLYGLLDAERVIVDGDGQVAAMLQVPISPAVVRLRDGVPVAAHTVPSPRRLEDELHWLRNDGVDQPTYGHTPEAIRMTAKEMETST
jgi:hypothetical protein